LLFGAQKLRRGRLTLYSRGGGGCFGRTRSESVSYVGGEKNRGGRSQNEAQRENWRKRGEGHVEIFLASQHTPRRPLQNLIV
jgi:hypothetical protein